MSLQIRFVFALFALMMLCGCDFLEEQKAEEAVKRKLSDPGSAQFRNLKTIRSWEVSACKSSLEKRRMAWEKKQEMCKESPKGLPLHEFFAWRNYCSDSRPADNQEDMFRRASDICELQPKIVCGEVNAKNKMGGYNGFRHFAFIPALEGRDSGQLVTPDDPFHESPVVGSDFNVGPLGPYFNCGSK